MALASDIVLLGLYDAKISPMTADVTGAPTYGTAIDVPGGITFSMTPTMESKELKGDGAILSTFSKIVGGEMEIKMAKLPLSALATLQGGALSATGTTPNQINTYDLNATVLPAYFKIEGAWDPAEVGYGDVHMIVWKCKVMEPPTVSVNDANGDYGDVTVKAKAVKTISSGKYFTIVQNETKTAIA